MQIAAKKKMYRTDKPIEANLKDYIAYFYILRVSAFVLSVSPVV